MRVTYDSRKGYATEGLYAKGLYDKQLDNLSYITNKQ